MPESLAEAIGASVDTGDTAPATPETATAPEVTTSEATTPTDTAETPATGESEWKIDSADFDQQHPELAPYRKQLQADYTRRQQEMAAERKRFEGVDEDSVQWTRQMRQLAQTNPEIAAQLLEAERQKLLGQNQQPQPDPYAETQWLSDGERFLAEQVKQLQSTVKQQELARVTAMVEAETAQLERTIGKSLSQPEREELYSFCAKRPGLNLEEGWKLKDYDRAIQRGRDQAAQVVAQKAGMGAAPSAVASREAPSADRTPKTAREALELAFDEAEKRAA